MSEYRARAPLASGGAAVGHRRATCSTSSFARDRRTEFCNEANESIKCIWWIVVLWKHGIFTWKIQWFQWYVRLHTEFTSIAKKKQSSLWETNGRVRYGTLAVKSILQPTWSSLHPTFKAGSVPQLNSPLMRCDVWAGSSHHDSLNFTRYGLIVKV